MSVADQSLFSLFHIGISIQQMNKKSERRSGLSLVQWCMLRHLIDMPAASAHSLSNAVGVHPSTLTQTLKRLGRKKYVFIAEDPKDSRKKIISITRAGKDALDKTSQQLKDWADDLSKLQAELSRVRSTLQFHLDKET